MLHCTYRKISSTKILLLPKQQHCFPRHIDRTNIKTKLRDKSIVPVFTRAADKNRFRRETRRTGNSIEREIDTRKVKPHVDDQSATRGELIRSGIDLPRANHRAA